MTGPRYDVSMWYGDPLDGGEGWHRHRHSLKLWTVRCVLRKLYRRCWSSISVLVERCDAGWTP